MYENMSRGSKEGFARADRYIDRVMANINALLEGDAQLTDSSGNLVTEIEGDWRVVATTVYPQTFNEDDPHNWRVSQDKLEDIEDDRS
jgi:hypothetical protein